MFSRRFLTTFNGCYYRSSFTSQNFSCLQFSCMTCDKFSVIHRNTTRLSCNQRWCSTLAVGAKASVTKIFTSKDVEAFAVITGDFNPIHLDENYAKTTRFGKTIVHGTLTTGLVSGLLGMKLPGTGSILVSLDLEFPAPLFVGEQVCAEVELAQLQGRRAVFNILCTAVESGRIVTRGKSLIVVAKESIRAKAVEVQSDS